MWGDTKTLVIHWHSEDYRMHMRLKCSDHRKSSSRKQTTMCYEMPGWTLAEIIKKFKITRALMSLHEKKNQEVYFALGYNGEDD